MRRPGVTTALSLGTIVTAGLLVGLPLGSPAAAAADCLSEPPVGLFGTSCDDTVPPET